MWCKVFSLRFCNAGDGNPGRLDEDLACIVIQKIANSMHGTFVSPINDNRYANIASGAPSGNMACCDSSPGTPPASEESHPAGKLA
jgi:hypothetical protein